MSICICSCPKCGGSRIDGPRYEKALYGRGRLRYTCLTCCWFWFTPTLDDKGPRPKGAPKAVSSPVEHKPLPRRGTA